MAELGGILRGELLILVVYDAFWFAHVLSSSHRVTVCGHAKQNVAHRSPGR